MSKLIYYIGGPSASGKSVIARSLSELSGCPHIELDKIHNLVKHPIPDGKQRWEATLRLVEELIQQLLQSGTPCILEGGWIEPEQAGKWRERWGDAFYPVYCGYPNADADQRLFVLRKGNAHWLYKHSSRDPREWIRQQIEGSRWNEKECLKHGIPFFDFGSFDEGGRHLSSNYKAWYGKELPSPFALSFKAVPPRFFGRKINLILIFLTAASLLLNLFFAYKWWMRG